MRHEFTTEEIEAIRSELALNNIRVQNLNINGQTLWKHVPPSPPLSPPLPPAPSEPQEAAR